MRAGKLSQRVEIWIRSTAVSDLGEHSESFDVSAIRYASIEPLQGREYFSAVGVESNISTRIRLRYDSITAALTTTDRLKSNGILYNIKSIINPDGRSREVVLMCETNDREN